MTELFGFENEKNENWPGVVWVTTKAHYSRLENADESLYLCERYKQYAEQPQEVAKKIVSIVHELEKV